MTEMVHVPVPIDRLQEVYEVLAKRPVESAPVQWTEDGYPPGWSRVLIDRMYIESSSAMRRILSAVAHGSPGWITTSEIADACSLTPRQVIASFGPFEKRCRGRYGMKERPFAAREFVDEGIIKYSMLPGAASQVLELSAQLEKHERERA